MTQIADPATVLAFWREAGPKKWFTKDDAFDRGVRERFLATYEAATAGELSAWEATPEGALALAIVLDQFPRNMFRDSPRAYAADPIARRLARIAVEQGLDRSMTDQERNFLYLPFEHSEDREDQALSIHLIGQLGHDEWTRHALAHRSIIDRFGRFPHRNAILGRTSTPDELVLLNEPMGSF